MKSLKRMKRRVLNNILKIDFKRVYNFKVEIIII